MAGSITYAPLADHEIRLLHLKPGLTTDMIVCTLEIVDLTTKPAYEALSYEWGDEKMSKPEIMVDSNLVTIRDNLWWALYYIRYENIPRFVWIDALCINQGDWAERNHQVAQMGSIYAQADEVIAWIGLDQSFDCVDTRMAFKTLEKLSSSPDISSFEYSLFRDFNSMFADGLFDRSYWSRLWIIQEIVIADKLFVHCGSCKISWDKIATICEMSEKLLCGQGYEDEIALIGTSAYSLFQRRREYASATKLVDGYVRTLSQLVVEFSESECHDSRDKVFGILAICCSCCSKANVADYSMNIYEIFVRLIEHDVVHHRTPDLEVVDQVMSSLRMVTPSNPKERQLTRSNITQKSLTPDFKISASTQDLGKINYICPTDMYDTPAGGTHDLISSEEDLFVDDIQRRKFILISTLLYHNRPFFNSKSRVYHQGSAYFNSDSDYQTVQGKVKIIPRPASRRTISRKFQRFIKRIHIDEPAPIPKTSMSVTEINNFLRSTTEECAPLLRKLGVVLFATSTGVVGVATKDVRLGNRVLRIVSYSNSLWDSVERRLLIRSDGGLCTGKGLLLVGSLCPRPMEEFVDMFLGEFRRRRSIELEIQVATLLYVAGYF